MGRGTPHRSLAAYERQKKLPSDEGITFSDKTHRTLLEIANERFVARLLALCEKEGWRV